jgi:acyl carrier protein
VVHAAGVARQVLVTEATAADFDSSFRAKVDGTWLLHQALEPMPLDFFVLFSSASAVLSSPRVGPYAAANAFLDAMAEYRSKKGLPALSVGWGAWTGFGMAAGTEMSGMKLQEGLSCFGRLLVSSGGHICVIPTDWRKWASQYPAYMAKPFFSTLMAQQVEELQAARSPVPASGFLNRLNDAPEASRLGIVRDLVAMLALRVLGFPPSHRIDPAQPLNELGLDSLTALEFRNALAAETGQTLPATLVFNYPAIEDITAYLAKLLFEAPGHEPVVVPEGEDRNTLDDIEGLSDEEVERMLKKWGAVR